MTSSRSLLYVAVAVAAAGGLGWLAWRAAPEETPRGANKAAIQHEPGREQAEAVRRQGGDATPVANVSHFTEPPQIELQRRRIESAGATEASPTALATDIDCGYAPNATRLSDTHYRIDFADRGDPHVSLPAHRSKGQERARGP